MKGKAQTSTSISFFGEGEGEEAMMVETQEPPSSTGRSIPLISFEDDTFVVGKEAQKILQDMEPPIAVVAVAGLYRTGKSFLLNRVILQRPGFSVGSTVNACTKGIWMWSEPVMTTDANGRPVKVLVVDTEGIGAPTADASHDTRVFSLGLLLSSFFVYNSVGSIDEQALSNLSLVTNISKEIRVSAAATGEEEDGGKEEEEEEEEDGSTAVVAAEFAEFLPAFLWVVRDFSLQLEDTNGQEIGAEEYLENALEECRGKNAAGKNRIRDCLKQFFPQRGCVTLVRPCLDEKNLQRLDSLPDSSLRPEFMRQAKKLRERVMTEAARRPLTMQGKELSGSMLGFLCHAYSDAINKGGAPVIHDAWTYVCEAQRMRTEQQLVEQFLQGTSSLVEAGMSPPLFRQAVLHLQSSILQKYGDICRDLGGGDVLGASSEAGFAGRLTQTVDGLYHRNHQRFLTVLQQRAVEDQDRLAEAGTTFQNFRTTYGDAQTEFARTFLEPVLELPAELQAPYPDAPSYDCEVEAVWARRTLPVIWRAVNRFYGAHEQEQLKLVTDLQTARTESQQTAERYGEELQKLRTAHSVALENVKREHVQQLSKAQGEIVEVRSKLEDAEMRITTLEAEVVQCSKASHNQVGELQQQLVLAESRADSAEAQIGHLRNEVEELQEVQTSLEAKELELSGVTITRDRLQTQLLKLQKEMEIRKADFNRVEETYRREGREIQEKALQSVDRMKEVRKAEQKKLKLTVAEERQAHEQTQAQASMLGKEVETLRRQQLEAATVYEDQMTRLRSQVEECDTRLADSKQQYVLSVKEVEEKARRQREELEAKEVQARERAMQLEKEWNRVVKEMETRAVGAETRLSSQKRQLDQAEEILQRKRAKTDDPQTSLELVKARAELEWLRRQTSDHENQLALSSSRIMELEARVREHERTSDTSLTYLRLDYENRIAVLEEELANK